MAILRSDVVSRLKDLVRDYGDKIEIARVALLLAQVEYPGEPIDPFLSHLEELTNDLHTAGKGVNHIHDVTSVLSDVLFRFHGYVGDAETYDDIQNANLMRVIDRRKGLPVALGILLIHMARAQGWTISGLNFPGHFLLRITHKGEQVIIDPFRKGRQLKLDNLSRLLVQIEKTDTKIQPQHLKSVGDREILLRLQNNIKTRLLETGDIEHALAILETMSVISPDNAGVISELAFLESRSGYLKQAERRLKLFVDLYRGHPDESEILTLLKNLKRHLN